MLLQSKGVVLQSFKYGENSLISRVLSEEKGLISLLSNKTKRKKNKQGNFFQPLSAIEFVCYLSSKSNIHRVKELTYNNSIGSSPDNVSVNAIRFFLAEVLSKVIKEEEQNFHLYKYVEEKLRHLNTESAPSSSFHITFLMGLMDMLGIQPLITHEHTYFDLEQGEGCATKPNHPNFFTQDEVQLYKTGQDTPEKLLKIERSRLLNIIINYYNTQLGGLANLKSKAVLEVVFG
ncbi:DNA repair protein RecO [Vicingaceae bacterium]|nr:DNA repair protein RecO [Vicingaceae bacterium]MDC0004807.1 DNA repair protein RecO [bacterium]MDC1451412.1 DNA repair protein RecO [Vicingaceae bacterium]